MSLPRYFFRSVLKHEQQYEVGMKRRMGILSADYEP
jgi:hypothetical protein